MQGEFDASDFKLTAHPLGSHRKFYQRTKYFVVDSKASANLKAGISCFHECGQELPLSSVYYLEIRRKKSPKVIKLRSIN